MIAALRKLNKDDVESKITINRLPQKVVYSYDRALFLLIPTNFPLLFSTYLHMGD